MGELDTFRDLQGASFIDGDLGALQIAEILSDLVKDGKAFHMSLGAFLLVGHFVSLNISLSSIQGRPCFNKW